LLEKAFKQVSLAREAGALRQRLESPLAPTALMIGKSAPMRRLYQQIGQIAPTDAAVLVAARVVLEKTGRTNSSRPFAAREGISRSQLRRDFPNVDGK